jgi:hypothetical protein
VSRVRWACPNGCASVLAASRPRGDDVARFCLPCSAKVGKLVRRFAPSLEVKREKREAARKEAAKRGIAREAAREIEYYTVEGIDLLEELKFLYKCLARLGRNGGELPELKVRRASRRQRRHGFARIGKHLISITWFPGLTAEDLRETLAHEVSHLVVGNPGDGWHGVRFKACFRQLVEEAWGVRPRLDSKFHGEVSRLLREKTGSPIRPTILPAKVDGTPVVSRDDLVAAAADNDGPPELVALLRFAGGAS